MRSKFDNLFIIGILRNATNAYLRPSRKRFTVLCENAFQDSSGGVNFDYLPRRGGIGKIKKRRWKYGAGAGLLKKEGAETFSI